MAPPAPVAAPVGGAVAADAPTLLSVAAKLVAGTAVCGGGAGGCSNALI